MAYNTYKGIFRPQNHQKYKGDSSNIVYRSKLASKATSTPATFATRPVSVIRLGSRIHAVSLVHRVDVVRKGGCKTPLLLYSLRTRIYSAHTTGLADVIETYGQCAITRKVYHG